MKTIINKWTALLLAGIAFGACSEQTEYVGAEIQIRTIAMDFWASLEHDIRYKVDKTKLPEGINEEMFECAGKIAEIDRQMQDMYQRIKASDAYNED